MTVSLHVWTDGSGTTEQHPCGAGVVVVREDVVLAEHARALPNGTNNIAECLALVLGVRLALAIDATAPIIVCSDSQFALDACAPWSEHKIKRERLRTLIGRIRAELRPHVARLTLRLVKGHSGLVYNERADVLAGMARKRMVEALAARAA
jgi:ribonuclease HI